MIEFRESWIAGQPERKSLLDAELVVGNLSFQTTGNEALLLVNMSTEQPIELEGVIKAVLPGTMFKVTLDNGHEVLAHISGKMRKHFVRLTVGDRVRIEMSPYDLTKARITYRLR